MNEPNKDNPKAPKRSKRRPAMEPLGWDEIVSQPGMGGYLSFLNGPVPLPHLQGPAAAAAVVPVPGVDSTPRIETAPEVICHPEVAGISESKIIPESDILSGTISDPGVDSIPGHMTNPEAASTPIAINKLGFVCSGPGVISTPPPEPNPGAAISPAPEVVSIPAIPAGRFRIRRCAATHDGHSLGEEVLYQALWKAALPESADTRTIVIGWRGMSQLCRMTPKNCKINTQRLVRKLALEVLSPYNTPESIGTTYRVYGDHAILQRRREAGLEWVVRSRGVEFVDPGTGASILPICAPTYQN
jgi:hypothetical protein